VKIQYFSKRFYMNQDLIKNRYGRIYAHCSELSKLGHQVKTECLAYYPSDDCIETHSDKLHWRSRYLGRLFWKLPFIILKLLNKSKNQNADVFVGASDHIHIAIAYLASRAAKKPLVVDLYDNFESFGIGKIPGLNYVLRHCLSKAQLITCVSPALTQRIQSMLPHAKVITLLSTVDRNQFKAQNKRKCRQEFKLPVDKVLVGCAGNLRRMMGIDLVYEAFKIISTRKPDVHFVLAGPEDENCPVPKLDNSHYLGMLPHETVPSLLCCLDVGIVYQSNSGYGHYAFPQKALEVAACQIPMVAANVGSIPLIFHDIAQYLYDCDSANSLAQCILAQIEDRQLTHITFDDWQSQSEKLADLLSELVPD
jgi:teichuronic acid biosynthesis glycosyltransferase TuaC